MPSPSRVVFPLRRRGPWLAAALLALALAPAAASPQRAARLYDSGLQRYEKDDFAGAAVDLRNALQADPRNLAAHLLLARVFERAGDLQAAQQAYEEALRQGVSRTEVVGRLGRIYLSRGENARLLSTIYTEGLPDTLRAEVLTLRGTAMSADGNVDGALQAFGEARTLDPRSPAPLLAEAQLHLRQRDRERARGLARRATELAPNDESTWFQLGSIQQAAGEMAPALASFDRTIALNPRHADARIGRSAALIALHRNEEADKELALLKAEKVVEPRASFLRATRASQRGDEATARAEYTDAANLIDGIAPASLSTNEPLLLAGALSHRALGSNQSARQYLDSLLARNGRHKAASMLMATVLLEGNELGRASKLIGELVRNYPDDPQVQYLNGTLLLARKQFGAAAEALDRSLRLGGGNAALRELSFSQFGIGQNQVALANLEKVFAANPRDQRAGIELAVVYARMGQGAKAVATAEALVRQEPGNLTLVNFLGNVKGRLRDFAGARKVWEQALARDPRFRPTVMNLSWLDIDEGRFDAARTRLLAHLKDKPRDPDVLFQMGVLEQRARRDAEALKYWEQADSSQTKDPRAGLASVQLLIGSRQFDRAAAAARSLVGRYPESVPVHLVAAQAQLRLGDRVQARNLLVQANRLAGFDAPALLEVARLQLAVDHLEGASYTLDKALQAEPNALPLLSLAVELASRRGVPAEVDRALGVLMQRHPNEVVAQITAGHVAFARNDLARAVNFYRTAFEREPSTGLMVAIVRAQMGLRQPDAALATAQAWARKAPGDASAQRALADTQALVGKPELARDSYAALVKADPENPSLLAGYAQLLARLNDPQTAAVAEKAYRLDAANTALADLHGSLLMQRGDVDGGLRVLRDARLREPDNGLLRWRLALALSKAGRKNEARDELRAALASRNPPPPGPELSQLRAELGV
jgi:putative PEP-CTERM system TPR-repeat lipoprotein